ATRKGYSVKDIKSALETCQIMVSERAIKEIISTHPNTRRKSSRNQKKSSSASDMQSSS
ncbi:mobilization protein MobC, partial [Escherichia coli]|nr:mobilization protein MobC [Escherichia coli]